MTKVTSGQFTHELGRYRLPRPKDNKFLEVALNGNADLILTSDKDLLVLDPFHGIRIVTPRLLEE